MAKFDELRILQLAEAIADEVWKQVGAWQIFARDVVGGQLARAVDSIGANIAESFGRYHFGEKLQFLYYARGSLFESKYWVNRALKRDLMREEVAKQHSEQLTDLARQLNSFAAGLKTVKQSPKVKSFREESAHYAVAPQHTDEVALFDTEQLNWLQSSYDIHLEKLESWGVAITNHYLPITNY
jgi:four helix bundle protein